MKLNFKNKVIANAKRQKEEKHQQQNVLFQIYYNKTKNYEFPKVSDINLNRFFFFPKFDEDFCMSKSSIAIYPVLCLQSDFEQSNWFQISQNNIAIMAGVSVNTVSKGIKDLERYMLGDELFLEKKKKTEGTRHYYVYKVNYLRKNQIEEWQGDYIAFHKCIIDSGIWAALKPRAKALYLSMRMNAHFDSELYELIEDIGLCTDSNDFWQVFQGDNYRNRKWDVCNNSLVELCRKVQITPTNLKPVIQQLEYHRLIERVGTYEQYFKVYLKPKIREF